MWLALGALAAVVAPFVCRPLLRYPVLDRRPATSVEETLLSTMNPFVLTNLVSDRLVVEIDWVEGYPPSRRATDGLARTLHDYCPGDKRIEILVDDPIPRERWDAQEGRLDWAEAMAAEFLDHDPSRWREYELLYVLYTPGPRLPLTEPGGFGVTTTLTVEREGRPETVSAVVVVTGTLERRALLWIGPRKLERSVLIHELGHVLGLVQNPTHTQRDNPRHCTEPQCVMPHPRPRSIAYNLLPALFAGRMPTDYCNKCRADIRGAQELWERRSTDDPDVVRGIHDRRRVERLERAARWYRAQSRFDEALRELERAVEIRPEDPALHFAHGWAQLERWRPEEALPAFREAARLDRGAQRAGARSAAALALCELGRFEEALEELDRATAGGADTLLGCLARERALAGSGRHAAAARVWEHYASVPRSDGERVFARAREAACHRRAGELARAEAVLREELARGPGGAALGLDVQVARVLRARGAEEARARLAEIVARERSSLEETGSPAAGRYASLAKLAEAAAVLGQGETARRALDALSVADGSPALPAFRARVLALLDDVDGAIEQLAAYRSQGYVAFVDPCGDEDLAPVRSDPRFGELFPHCPGAR